MENRLAERRKALGLTQKEIAESVGVSEATVSRWESGEIANMRRDRIAAYARALKTTPEFIMTGETPVEFRPEESVSRPGMKQIPLVGRIACGEPILAEQNVERQVEVPADVPCDFALYCRGESMSGAGIHDGDIVYLCVQPEVENGQIAAVRIGEEATLKRVYLHRDFIELRPENPAFESIIRRRDEMNEVHIEGRVVGYTHWFF